MDKWYSPNHYFQFPPDHPLAALTASLDKVWDILDHLKEWIEVCIQPNVSPLIRRGGFIVRPAALFQGAVLEEELEYELDSKGGLSVRHQGLLLPGASLVMPGVFLDGSEIQLGQGVLIEPGAMIKGPAVLGDKTHVRQGAYIRGGVWTLDSCLIGHATEAKNTLLLSGAKAGHFAYLGDSILGRDVNLGAGTKLANLKMTSSPFVYRHGEEVFQSLRRKTGAILGDGCQTGCNTVANPGTLLAPQCRVLPNTSAAGGYYPPRSVIRPKRQ